MAAAKSCIIPRRFRWLGKKNCEVKEIVLLRFYVKSICLNSDAVAKSCIIPRQFRSLGKKNCEVKEIVSLRFYVNAELCIMSRFLSKKISSKQRFE